MTPPRYRVGYPTRHLDGIVLADALRDPTATEVNAQLHLSTSLAPHQDALIDQSDNERREDDRDGVRPPPRAQIHP